MKGLIASVVIVFVLTNVTGAKHVEDLLETLSLRMTAFEEENRALKHENRAILTALNELSTRTAEKMSKRFLADNPAVAFTAVVAPPTLSLLGAGETLVFDTVITNVGNAYRNTTGLFRAPIKGVYVFNFALMMDPGLDEYIELVKDGNHIMWNYGHAPGSTHLISASRTAAVELEAGDDVWVRTQNSLTHGKGTIHGNGFTTFSGWLVAMTE